MDEILQKLASSGKTTAMNMIGRAQKFFDGLSDEEHTSIFKVQGLQPFNGLWTIGALIATGAAMLFLRYTLPHKPTGSCIYLERVTKDTFSKPFVSAECQIYQGSEILSEIIFLAFPFIAVLMIEIIDCKTKLKKYVKSQEKSMMNHLNELKDKMIEFRPRAGTTGGSDNGDSKSAVEDQEWDLKAGIFKNTFEKVDAMLKSTQLNLSEFSNSFKSHFADGLIQLIGIGFLIAMMIFFKLMIADKETQFQCPVNMPTGELMTMSCIYPSVYYTKIEVNLALFGCLPVVCVVFVVTMFTGYKEVDKRDKKLEKCSFGLQILINKHKKISEKLNGSNTELKFEGEFFDELNSRLEIFEKTTAIEFEKFEEGVSEFLDELEKCIVKTHTTYIY